MTGTLFAPVLKEMIAQLNERCATRLKVVGVPNEYFGGDVSVAGLLTGGDLVAARDQVVGDFVIIPQVTLKSDEPVMLDGMRLEQLQAQFDVPVIPCDFSAFSSLLRNGFQNN
jgi:NifB/MoaA-like Fe-S oxidoreductase